MDLVHSGIFKQRRFHIAGFIGLVLAVMGIVLCSSCVHGDDRNTTKGKHLILDIEKIKKKTRPLDLSKACVYAGPVSQYFSFYDMAIENTRHCFGTFQSHDLTLFAHVFIPPKPKGTVFLLHGYLDHSGTLKHLIRHCVTQGFAVSLYDLPGHGLSSGDRMAINDFSQYVAVFKKFIDRFAPSLPKPHHLAGHSTGCAVLFEYLNLNRANEFKKIVFLSPLVHNAYYQWSRTGHLIAKPFVDTIPRKIRNNSSDPGYLDFVTKDPLAGRVVSIRFLDALYAWDKRIKTYDVLLKPVLIIQGTDDEIIDWEYNLEFLRKKIKNLSIDMIKGAKHQLANERPKIRAGIFQKVTHYIESP